MIDIVPAIDIIGARCVRLTKGDYSSTRIYDALPEEMALKYASCGVKRIHIVDLDGARISSPSNLRTLEKVAGLLLREGFSAEVEWGGGISSSEALSSVFNAGAACAIIGSVAVKEPGLMHSWLTTYGPSRIVLGADVRDGFVSVSGWQEDSPVKINELLEEYLPDSLEQVICTDISRDGMLQGPSFDLYASLKDAYPGIVFTVSGGICSMADIERLDGMGLRKVIVGKAIYEGRITLEDIEKWSQNA